MSVIGSRATARQIAEMIEPLGSYIKLAVDIEREVLAGGGTLHADCEAELLNDGSLQEHVWGADWIPDTQQVRYEALINIRPGQSNPSMEILDADIRGRVGAIVTRLLKT